MAKWRVPQVIFTATLRADLIRYEDTGDEVLSNDDPRLDPDILARSEKVVARMFMTPEAIDQMVAVEDIVAGEIAKSCFRNEEFRASLTGLMDVAKEHLS